MTLTEIYLIGFTSSLAYGTYMVTNDMHALRHDNPTPTHKAIDEALNDLNALLGRTTTTIISSTALLVALLLNSGLWFITAPYDLWRHYRHRDNEDEDIGDSDNS